MGVKKVSSFVTSKKFSGPVINKVCRDVQISLPTTLAASVTTKTFSLLVVMYVYSPKFEVL